MARDQEANDKDGPVVPHMAALIYDVIATKEDAMPLKPRVKVKAQGIPIGNFDVVKDAAGKALIKPKRKPRALPQEIASRKRRRFKPAK